MIRIIIIGAQSNGMEKAADLLAAQGDMTVLARGNDGFDALKLAGSLNPGIAVIDSGLEFIGADEIAPLIKARSPSTAVILMAETMSDQQLYKALVNGADGLVHKESDIESLPGIVRRIAEGGCFISPMLAARVLRFFTGFPGERAPAGKTGDTPASGRVPPANDPAGNFSKTELLILCCIGKGYSGKETASALNLAPGTVRNYISAFMRKTGLRNRAQVTVYTLVNGLVPFSRETGRRRPGKNGPDGTAGGAG